LVGTNRATVIEAIQKVKLHDDSPYARMWPEWRNHLNLVNIPNPEDRDGDGEGCDGGTGGAGGSDVVHDVVLSWSQGP